MNDAARGTSTKPGGLMVALSRSNDKCSSRSKRKSGKKSRKNDRINRVIDDMDVSHRLDGGNNLGMGYGMVRGSKDRKVLINTELDEKLDDLVFNFECNINRGDISNNIVGNEKDLNKVKGIFEKFEVNNSSFNLGDMNVGGVKDMVQGHPPIQQHQQRHQRLEGLRLVNGLKVRRNGLIRHGVQVCGLGFSFCFIFVLFFSLSLSLSTFFTRE